MKTFLKAIFSFVGNLRQFASLLPQSIAKVIVEGDQMKRIATFSKLASSQTMFVLRHFDAELLHIVSLKLSVVSTCLKRNYLDCTPIWTRHVVVHALV